MAEKAKVLIISPHNDDALIGCFQFLTGNMTVLGVNVRNSDTYASLTGTKI
jgi:LmbE family N-acetylglucosaminyl deacetylase